MKDYCVCFFIIFPLLKLPLFFSSSIQFPWPLSLVSFPEIPHFLGFWMNSFVYTYFNFLSFLHFFIFYFSMTRTTDRPKPNGVFSFSSLFWMFFFFSCPTENPINFLVETAFVQSLSAIPCDLFPVLLNSHLSRCSFFAANLRSSSV